jgi:hypothetical protein
VRSVVKPSYKSANDLLIHRVAVPLLRWRRLTDKSKFENIYNLFYNKKWKPRGFHFLLFYLSFINTVKDETADVLMAKVILASLSEIEF